MPGASPNDSSQRPGGSETTARWFSPKPYSPLQNFFLLRVRAYARAQAEIAGSAEDWQVRLLNWAIYSTYRDCVALGVGGDARALVQAHAPPNRP